jgi:hypothetical protein
MRFIFTTAVVLMVAALAICPGWAALVSLTNQNSLFQIDPTAEMGASVWQVDGLDHLFMQQWFYRLSSGGSVLSINNLGAPAVTVSGTNYVQIGYAPAGFAVTLGYTLYGGSAGSGFSDVAETFRIENLGGSPLHFDLFEYSDFDLRPYGSDDSAEHVNANMVQQWDSAYQVSESVARTPDRWQISAPFAITGDLTNSTSPSLNTDCAWAFQWNLVVPAYGSIAFAKEKTIMPVPEPSSLLALASCLAGMCAFRRRRR